MPVETLQADQGQLSSQGAPQYAWRPAAKKRGVISNTTAFDAAAITARLKVFTAPVESEDLTAAGATFVITKNPTFNLLLRVLIGHASADGKTGIFYLFGVREISQEFGQDKVYLRTYLGSITCTCGLVVFTPSVTAPFPGLGTAPSPAQWGFADAITVASLIPSPAIQKIGEIAEAAIDVALDAWGFTWVEAVGVCGAASSGLSLLYTEA